DIEPKYFLLEEYLGKDSFKNASLMWDKLCADAPSRMKIIGVELLNKQTLTLTEATALGSFLFSDELGESFRGMAVSILRIRYETDEEYNGLYNAIKLPRPLKGGFHANSKQPTLLPFRGQGGLIQLAEPFDGVEHSYMITPIIANALQKQGYRVVVSCGRSSGPKTTLNTWDLYRGLKAEFLNINIDVNNVGVENLQPLQENFQHPTQFGWVLDQKIFYPALDKWVERRKIIMKRPFLSTLEKVLNPVKANILITSVFHIPYLEKMMELGIMAGFEGVIVLKRGLEGTLAPSLVKATGILCAAKKADGSIVIKNIDTINSDF